MFSFRFTCWPVHVVIIWVYFIIPPLPSNGQGSCDLTDQLTCPPTQRSKATAALYVLVNNNHLQDYLNTNEQQTPEWDKEYLNISNEESTWTTRHMGHRQMWSHPTYLILSAGWLWIWFYILCRLVCFGLSLFTSPSSTRCAHHIHVYIQNLRIYYVQSRQSERRQNTQPLARCCHQRSALVN